MSQSRRTTSPQQDLPGIRSFVTAVAEDLRLFALLHDREPTKEIVEALHSCPFREQLSILLRRKDAQAALEAFDCALAALPEPAGQAVIDDLSVEYANVYLRYLYRASPAESVWFDDDGLERQQTMFEAREWYRRHDLKAGDWSKRPDDHLVLQLEFVAHLIQSAHSAEDLKSATAFMDDHLLQWCGLFADQLSGAGAAPYFAGLARVTELYLEELRDHLTDITSIARKPSEKVPSSPTLPAEESTVEQYAPGTAPGW